MLCAMDHNIIMEGFGITPEWVHQFLTESNLIDPQPGPSEPGSLIYDGHRDALLYALLMAASDRYAPPLEVYKLLAHGHHLANGLRAQKVRVGDREALAPQLIKHELWKWNRRLYQTVDLLRTDDDSIPVEHKKSEIWGLHCELMNILPYDRFNGKVGRVLMVNHALLTDTPVWVIPAASRQEYFNVIRRHPSAQWGTNPPVEDQL